MDKLPYQEGEYERFLDTLGHWIDYIEGKPYGLPRYSLRPDSWRGSPYQHKITPEQALLEFTETVPGTYDAWINTVRKPSGIQSHIINVTTQVEGSDYLFSYDLSEPVSDTNGIHFFKIKDSL